jgi:hypothetical protein
MEQQLTKDRSRMEMEGKDNKHNRQNIQSITPTRPLMQGIYLFPYQYILGLI